MSSEFKILVLGIVIGGLFWAIATRRKGPWFTLTLSIHRGTDEESSDPEENSDGESRTKPRPAWLRLVRKETRAEKLD